MIKDTLPLKEQIQEFFGQMDNDMTEIRAMIRTEENLIKAVAAYRKAWNLDPSKEMVIPAEISQ